MTFLNSVYITQTKSEVSYGEVEVRGAKREIAKIDDQSIQILTVHAPSYGKGDAETVEQLSSMIANSKAPTLAIGGFNIDVEELLTVTEKDGTPTGRTSDLRDMRHRHGDNFFCDGSGSGAGTKTRRRWHSSRGFFDKTCPKTQKSCGTLDYVVAPKSARIDVSIVPYTMNGLSDHAVIITEVSAL